MGNSSSEERESSSFFCAAAKGGTPMVPFCCKQSVKPLRDPTDTGIDPPDAAGNVVSPNLPTFSLSLDVDCFFSLTTFLFLLSFPSALGSFLDDINVTLEF